MLGCGLSLAHDRLLALAAASHSGEDLHVSGVREMLSGAGRRHANFANPLAG
jgi:L-asparaginase II